MNHAVNWVRGRFGRLLGVGALVVLAATAVWAACCRPAAVAEQPSDFTAPPSSYECRWTDEPITLDGKADEAAWKHAESIDHFYLPWLGKNARAARTATRAKLLWDREYLYFFAEMEDTDLYADITEHDGRLWDNDVFELFFKPAEEKPGYYEFQINPAGTVLDMFLPRRGAGGYDRFRKDGDFHVEAKVKLDGTLNHWQDKDRGWSVEGRIPWSDFLRTGGRPEAGETWKFALCRYDYSVDFEGPETSTCAPLKTANFHAFEDYARLKFVGPDAQASAVHPYGVARRVPLTTSRVVGSPDPPLPYRVKKAYPDLKINYPVAVRRQPGSDRLLFLTEPSPYAPTTLRRMKDDPATTEFETLLKQNGVAYDITFHPDFLHNGYVYLGLNGALKADGSGPKYTRVLRYTIERKPPYRFDPGSEKVIIEWKSDGHNGGALAFGKDGMLYVTSGDGTSDSDRDIVGQDLSRLTAKVLRIDVDHPAADKMYAVPKDNPFVDVKDARPETWAYGLRNPWRLAVDAKTGAVWVGNNGQDLWEQVYFIRKGENYGWSIMEGSHPFYLDRKPGPTPISKPALEHPHSEARSLTGGLVYYGERFPELQGAYLYGDYSTGKIWAARHDGTKVTESKLLADSGLMITGFGVDSHGEILIADHQGQDKGNFYTLEKMPADLPASTFPHKLSESGLFRSVKGHVMQPALIPYSVNAPLWSDGAFKERFIALPGADSRIEFGTWRGWNFPDQTVLVKSFALEMEEGNAQSRRWIETRFLTKQGTQWAGYSYVWNDDQTEGTLVESAGQDRKFSIKTATGKREQTWHYPSRTECMVCHSRAANFVLGLSELQMNKVHNYAGVADNQLRTMEHLGVFRVNWVDEAKGQMREEAKARGLSEKEVDQYLARQTETRDQRQPRDSALLAFPPSHYRQLVDPYDAKKDLTARARSYLHANCSQCHVEAGGGNAQMELEYTTELKNSHLLDVKPLHHTFALQDARLIAPGHPERSVLLQRIAQRQPGFMPPLATSVVDRQAVEMLDSWIKQLPEQHADK